MQRGGPKIVEELNEKKRDFEEGHKRRERKTIKVKDQNGLVRSKNLHR